MEEQSKMESQKREIENLEDQGKRKKLSDPRSKKSKRRTRREK